MLTECQVILKDILTLCQVIPVPRKPDKARRRELASRAFEALRARGVHKTTMSDLAAALGMKRPTLYFYFKDMGEVFFAVLGEMEARFHAFVAGRLATVDHPVEYLDALIQAQLDYYEGRPDLIVLMFQLWAVGGSKDPDRVLAHSRAVVGAVRENLVARLETGIADGLVAECDAAQIVDLSLAIADGALVHLVTRNAPPAPIIEGFRERVLAPLIVCSPPGRRKRARRSK